MSTDYSKMSDFEINKMICDVFWHDLRKSPECENKSFPQNTSIVYMHNGYGGFSRDYCNNPADAWPIISDSRISIYFDQTIPEYEGEFKQWCCAISPCQNYQAQYQSNPLRAAMIVFLMMQEPKNAS